jgi:hypothetical protein
MRRERAGAAPRLVIDIGERERSPSAVLTEQVTCYFKPELKRLLSRDAKKAGVKVSRIAASIIAAYYGRPELAQPVVPDSD